MKKPKRSNHYQYDLVQYPPTDQWNEKTLIQLPMPLDRDVYNRIIPNRSSDFALGIIVQGKLDWHWAQANLVCLFTFESNVLLKQISCEDIPLQEKVMVIFKSP
jgi:hypothetical protein